MPHALDGTPWPGGRSASTVIGWYRRPSARCLQPGYRCMGDEFSVDKYVSVADYMADLPRKRRAAMPIPADLARQIVGIRMEEVRAER